MKKDVLKNSQNSQENTSARASFLTKLQAASGFINKETLALVFSCEFCEIFKNAFFTEHLWATASESNIFSVKIYCIKKTQYQSLPQTSINSIRYFNP